MKTRRVHLLPLISFLPLIAALILATYFELYLDNLFNFIIALSYVVINVIYRMIKKTLNVSYVIEYSLVSILAYFILTLYT